MRTVIVEKDFDLDGRHYAAGRTLILKDEEADQLELPGIVQTLPDRIPGSRDKMLYPAGIRRGGITE